MTKLVFDIETNGLYFEAECIHCISIKDILTQETLSFTDNVKISHEDISGNLEEALELLSTSTELIGHNIINFDLPVLKKLYNWTPNVNTKITDTLVISRLLNPDRPKPSDPSCKGGPHSLEAWGYRTGVSKPTHEDWSVFSADMLRRNRQDVEINYSVYHLLQSEQVGWDWGEALEIEHEVARILTQQEINGVAFNVTYARELVDELNLRIQSIDNELLPRLPRTYKPWGAIVNQPFKNNGQYKKMVTDWYPDIEDINCIPVHGPFTRLETHVMNLGSMDQVKTYLLAHGWQPTEWNYNDDGERTSPKLTEDSYGSITSGMGKLIKDRLLYSHRRAQIEGWIERVRSDGRITAGINPCGTNTGRARHHDVVNVPKAAEHVFFGKEMRSLFTASTGRVLVGHDADGLELRMLAHYMDDPEYTKTLLEGKKEDGTDIHSVNQRLAGLSTRDSAKTFIYALIYGAGDGKLGSIVGGTKRDGTLLRKRFLDSLPALKRLIERVRRASKKGFLKGLDGRKVWMRYSEGRVMEHKALNTLLQSAGAIVMKKSMCLLHKDVLKLFPNRWEISEENTLENYHSNLFGTVSPTQKDFLNLHIPVLKVLDFHDESQADILPEYVELYKDLAVKSVEKAGEYFKMKIPLAASAASGLNWALTH